MTILTALRRATVLSLVAVMAASCSDDTKVVAQEEVEQDAAVQLAAAVDQPEPNISCPDDLDAEVGATMECELSVDGDPVVYPVYIEVTALENGEAVFTAEVGESPIE